MVKDQGKDQNAVCETPSKSNSSLQGRLNKELLKGVQFFERRFRVKAEDVERAFLPSLTSR